MIINIILNILTEQGYITIPCVIESNAEWKRISSHPDYIISTNGDIIRILDDYGHIADKCITQHLNHNNSSGRYQVKLYRDGVSSMKYVSILVAETFIPNPENKPEVHHKNGDKYDNRAQNLQWVTKEEHAELHKAIRAAKKNGGC